MSRPTKTQTRARIVAAASDLFYQQGYHATSVDQVIAAAGVSKPAVYTYFPTKEALCLGYLDERARREGELMESALKDLTTPRGRYVAIIWHVKKRIKAWEYRGCGFTNMLAEFPDQDSPIAVTCKRYLEAQRDLVTSVVQDLKVSSPHYAGLDAQAVADEYSLLIAGAISACQQFREDWPIERAAQRVDRLVG